MGLPCTSSSACGEWGRTLNPKPQTLNLCLVWAFVTEDHARDFQEPTPSLFGHMCSESVPYSTPSKTPSARCSTLKSSESCFKCTDTSSTTGKTCRDGSSHVVFVCDGCRARRKGKPPWPIMHMGSEAESELGMQGTVRAGSS